MLEDWVWTEAQHPIIANVKMNMLILVRENINVWAQPAVVNTAPKHHSPTFSLNLTFQRIAEILHLAFGGQWSSSPFEYRQKRDSSIPITRRQSATVHVRWYLNRWRCATLCVSNTLLRGTRLQICAACSFRRIVLSQTCWDGPSLMDCNNSCRIDSYC